MLARRPKKRRLRGENGNYWMSYSDLMAALLLMFVLLLFLSFNRYMTLQEEKEAELSVKEGQIAEQMDLLAQSEEALERREQELLSLRATLNTQQLELDEKTSALSQNKEELEQSLAQLLLQQKQIEEQEALLALSQQEVEEARVQLAASTEDLEEREILLSAKDVELLSEQTRVTELQAQLDSQRTQLDQQAARIDELVGVRARIIEQLRDAFLSENLNVAVDQTGSIRMDSTVFFDTNRAALKEDGRALLDQVFPVYARTLLKPENAEFVGEVIIEGHTDSDGSYALNLDLSQRRAQAVVNYCLSDDFTGLTAPEKDQLQTMLTANGRSKSQLIYDAYGNEDKAASRRVEIKFRLKDAEMIESLNRILTEMDISG